MNHYKSTLELKYKLLTSLAYFNIVSTERNKNKKKNHEYKPTEQKISNLNFMLSLKQH